MPAAPRRTPADTNITMRVPAPTRDLIDQAARSLGKSRTEFMLDSARREAIDTLLDQRVFPLDEAASEAFAAVLANPPKAGPELRALMKRRAPWE